MILARELSFAISVIATAVMIVAALLFENLTAMGVAGLIGALAALLCALFHYLVTTTDPEPDRLSHMAVEDGELRPVWDYSIGAPE